MLTQNKKLALFKLFSFGVVVTSVSFLLFVLERFFAAVANLYKFYIAWPAPIYVIASTFFLFCGALFSLIVVTFLLRKFVPKEARRAAGMLSISMWLNLGTIGILVVMVSAKLVTFSY